MITGKNSSEDITTVNLYIVNGLTDFIKQTLISIKDLLGPDTMIVSECYQFLTFIPRWAIQIKNQERYVRSKLHMDQMDLTDIYKIFHSTEIEYSFFSAAHKTFFKIDHILDHKSKS